jgi:hypothetical protein
MNKIQNQAKPGHIIVRAIISFIGRLRQNPDVYPIRYYKKNRRFRNNFDGQTIK